MNTPEEGKLALPAAQTQRAPDKLEDVACNACGSRSTHPFRKRAGYRVVTCTDCGLVYVNPRPNAARLAEHYRGDESSRVRYYLDAEPADRRSYTELLARLERLQPQKGDLLDVGPNVGTCLALARERGWRVRGIEINADAARYCREMRGLDVQAAPMAPGVFPESSFDAVVLGDVIEHLPDPLAALRAVHAVLRPGGVVVISTPDIGGWAARALQIKPEEHLYYFTPATLAALVQRAGLETLEAGPFDRHHNLTAMTHSTTLGGLLPRLAPLFRLAQRLLGDVVVRLPLRENVLLLARRAPAGGA